MRVRQALFAAALAACAWGALEGTAQACPMCSQSIAEDNSLPRAYMYSILFMMSMPAVVFCGISVCIYRVMKRRPHFTPQEAVAEGNKPAVGADPFTAPGLTVGT
jgi:hypothetical protein